MQVLGSSTRMRGMLVYNITQRLNWSVIQLKLRPIKTQSFHLGDISVYICTSVGCLSACLHAAISNVTSHKSWCWLRISSHCFRLLAILHTKELFHVAGSATKSERIAIGISITKALTVAHLGSNGAVFMDFHTNFEIDNLDPLQHKLFSPKLRHILHKCQVLLQHLEWQKTTTIHNQLGGVTTG